MKLTSPPKKPLILLSDEPIRDINRDGLGIKSWSRIVAEVARGTDGPFTVGIFGGWGVGKTSVLQLSKSFIDEVERQEDEQEIITVMFNAWQYDKESIPLIPLISAILGEIETRSTSVKTAKKGIKEFHTALRSILFSLSAGVKGGVPGFGDVNIGLNLQKAFDRYKKLQTKWIDQQIEKSIYYNALKSLENAQKDAGKIVVFIDDLDRCMPDKTLDLLESIKLILFHPGFIFVLAMDKDILESYLDKRYLKEFGLKKYQQGQSYLDKLVQLPLWIPQHNERFNALITKLLGPEPPINKFFTEFADQFGVQKEEFEHIHEALGLACQFNPRQLVRILNHLLIDKKIYSANSKSGDFPLKAFMVARGLRHQSEKIYNLLLSNLGICNEINKCSDLKCLQDLLTQMVSDPKLDMEVRKLFPQILENIHLCRLLLTEPGKKWLIDEDLQKKMIDRHIFEETELAMGSEYRLYREKQIHIAIDQLSSADIGEIMAGCGKLIVFGNPVPSTAITKLQELLNHEDSNVKREAKTALNDLAPEVVC